MAMSTVRQRRPHIPPDQFDRVTDGRVLTGQDALDAGLVDQLGDLRVAFDLAKQQASLPSADLILYHRPVSYVGSPYATAPGGGPAGGVGGLEVNLVQFNFGDSTFPIATTSVGFYYLWQGE